MAHPAQVRTKREPPSIEEALFAAEGLADDLESRIEIAAGLMGVPVEEVRAVARRVAPANGVTQQIRVVPFGDRGERAKTVVVEHRRTRSVVVTPRPVRRIG